MEKELDLIAKAFGTDNPDEIFKLKSSGRQERTFSCGVQKAAFPVEDVKSMCKRAKIKYEDGYEGRIFTYRFTDATVDWYGDIVEAKGGDLKTYLKKHPVILAFHDNHTLPVGACLDCWYV